MEIKNNFFNARLTYELISPTNLSLEVLKTGLDIEGLSELIDLNYFENVISEIGIPTNENDSIYFTNIENFQRKMPGRNNHNAPKLIEKYNNLAREALSGGDKILSENYFQHADHFTRILNDQEKMKRTKNLENHSNNSDLHSKEENKSESLEKKV